MCCADPDVVAALAAPASWVAQAQGIGSLETAVTPKLAADGALSGGPATCAAELSATAPAQTPALAPAAPPTTRDAAAVRVDVELRALGSTVAVELLVQPAVVESLCI